MINVLAPEIVNLIRAGEVIENPVSVVKELIENSIDAKSSRIEVYLKEGGKIYIGIKDNGIGMEPSDCRLSVRPHTTSKIDKAVDLKNILTLGFRGEALASIASIAKMTITTKPHGITEGSILKVEEGNIIDQRTTGSPDGTFIEIENIFYNTPARLAYLKSKKKELIDCSNLVSMYAIAHPKISFILKSEGQCLLQTPGSGDLTAAIASVYGRRTAQNMIKINTPSIKGMVSKPGFTRGDKSHIQITLNSRPIKSDIIGKAIIDSYHTMLHSKRYPLAFIHLQLNPKSVDVNVHPTKLNVKFLNEQIVYEEVYNAIQESITLTPLISENEVQKILDVQIGKKIIVKQEEKVKQPVFSVRILGIIHDCYILADTIEGLVIVDQHAADERYKYEMLMSQFSSRGIATQSLISPEHLELSPKDNVLISDHLENLVQYGFKVEPFGNNSFILRSSPVIMGRQQHKPLLLDVLDEMETNKVKALDKIKENIITRMACRSSIMKGDKIEIPEAKALIERLYTCVKPYTCPHGRPTIVKISEHELEKKFRRVN